MKPTLPPPEWELIDAEAAAAILPEPDENRPISPSTVARYTRQMLENKWKLSTDAICIGASGKAVNGQHRLKSVIESDLAQWFLVARWPVRHALELMVDTGRTRSTATLLNISNSNSAILSMLHKIRVGQVRGGSAATELEQYLEPFASELAAIHEACPTQRRGVSTAPIKTAVVLRMVEASTPDDVKALMTQYRLLVMNEEGRWPGVVGLYKHVTSRREHGDEWDLAERAYIAFDQKRNTTTIKISPKSQTLEWMKELVEDRMVTFAKRNQDRNRG